MASGNTNGQRLELILERMHDQVSALSSLREDVKLENKETRDTLTALRVQMASLASKEDVNKLVSNLKDRISTVETKHEALRADYKSKSAILGGIAALIVSIGVAISNWIKH